MENDSYLVFFSRISLHRMIDQYLPKLQSTLEILSKKQLWEEKGENLNSVGSIVLHIIEHINRNIIRLENTGIKFEQGIEDYFPTDSLETEELLLIVIDTFFEWGELLNKKIINYETIEKNIDLNCLYHLVEHTSYHLGQVVDRAKLMTGESFSFYSNGINEKELSSILEKFSV